MDETVADKPGEPRGPEVAVERIECDSAAVGNRVGGAGRPGKVGGDVVRQDPGTAEIGLIPPEQGAVVARRRVRGAHRIGERVCQVVRVAIQNVRKGRQSRIVSGGGAAAKATPRKSIAKRTRQDLFAYKDRLMLCSTMIPPGVRSKKRPQTGSGVVKDLLSRRDISRRFTAEAAKRVYPTGYKPNKPQQAGRAPRVPTRGPGRGAAREIP